MIFKIRTAFGMNIRLDDVIKCCRVFKSLYPRRASVECNSIGRILPPDDDCIIFLGTQIDDYTANTLQAQLLYRIL